MMKKFISFLLAMVCICTLSAKTLYLNPGGASLWDQAGAKFAAYYFGGEGVEAGWSDLMTASETQAGAYETTVPDAAENVIFVRLNSTATSGDWDAKWNQTADLTIADGNLYTITGWGADGAPCPGEWSTVGGSTTVASNYCHRELTSTDGTAHVYLTCTQATPGHYMILVEGTGIVGAGGSFCNVNGVGGYQLNAEGHFTVAADGSSISFAIESNADPNLYTPLYILMPGEKNFAWPNDVVWGECTGDPTPDPEPGPGPEPEPEPEPTDCDWATIEYLGDGAGGGTYSNLYKMCAPTASGVVNIQQPGDNPQPGIYVSFPSAITACSLEEGNYLAAGAGMWAYLSNFTAKETSFTVTTADATVHDVTVFFLNGTEGGEPTPDDDVYYIKNNWNNGEWTWQEMTPNADKTEWTYTGVFGGTGVNINTEQVDETATWFAAASIEGDAVEAGAEVTFTYNVAAGTVTAHVETPADPSNTVYYIKNNWNNGEWAWQEMTPNADKTEWTYTGVFGGTGVNINTAQSDETATWFAAASIEGDAVEAGAEVTFTYNVAAGTVTAHVETPADPSNTVYYIKNNWNNGEWAWQEMTPNADKTAWTYTGVFGGTGVNINTAQVDETAVWYAVENIQGDAIEAGNNVTFTYTVEGAILSAHNNEPTTGIDAIEADVKTMKMIENGMVIIVRGGIRYNMVGAIIK